MYKAHKNGNFRMRASFPITPERVIALNEICERQGKTFAQICQKAIDDFIALENIPLHVDSPRNVAVSTSEPQPAEALQ